jgi:hypothetical protein
MWASVGLDGFPVSLKIQKQKTKDQKKQEKECDIRQKARRWPRRNLQGKQDGKRLFV